jgi:hypothetical protein
MTDREHAEAARRLILAESEGPEARRRMMNYVAKLPPPDVKAIEAKVAAKKAVGDPIGRPGS